MSINSCVFVGTVGRDPEVKYFESGSAVAEFSIALNKPKKDGQDMPPTWIRVKAWNKAASLVADYVKKGHRIGVMGHMDEETWTDRQSGDKRSRLVCVADRIEFLTSRREAEAMSDAPYEDVPF